MKRSLFISIMLISLIGLFAWAGNEAVPTFPGRWILMTPQTNEKTTTSPFSLTSTAFQNGQPIPKAHARQPEGNNISPALQWKHVPDGTKEFALILDDPDAPNPKNPRPEGPWVHWVVAKLPAKRAELSENAGDAAQAGQKGFVEGKNSWGDSCYDGPLPPPGSGRHRYIFRLYALDQELTVKPELTKDELLAAMKGHILDQATLVGTYERK